jgi:hypothetical protein
MKFERMKNMMLVIMAMIGIKLTTQGIINTRKQITVTLNI